jgi:signal transduction histidine kinase/PAS domain-containing protein
VSRPILSESDVRPPVVKRFASDFSRLLADLDRLMADITTVIASPGDQGKPNGTHRKRNIPGTLTLCDQAQTFLQSLGRSATFHQQVPMPYLEIDRKGMILRMNKEGSSMLGAMPRPIVGRSLLDFVAGSHAQRVRDYLSLCSQTDRPGVIEILIKGQGSPVELRIRPHRVGKNAEYFSILMNRTAPADPADFTTANGSGPMSFQSLLSKMNRAYTLTSVYQLIGEYCRTTLASPEGMIFVQKQGKPHLASHWQSNPSSKKVLEETMFGDGLLAEAFRTGKPSFWPTAKKGRRSLAAHVQRALRDCKAGIALVPIGSSSEQPLALVVMILLHDCVPTPEFLRDLRSLGELASGSIARARAYDGILAQCLEAQSANRHKEEFLSVLSHELKSPLAPILGWAITLSSGALPPDKQSLAIEGIVRNARAMNYLIEDLFDVARISSGKLQLNISEMRLQEVVREALTVIQPSAEFKKLRISTDISEAIPPFLADPRRVRQVLINLLNNAVKFTPNGGTIALKVMRRGRTVQFSVSDSGRGIDPKFLPFVFDRFRQEGRSDKPSAAGLGLGLAIVKEITELHGGWVRAHSSGLDHGAIFTVHLPMNRRRVAPSVN